jgi:hypothetical protein
VFGRCWEGKTGGEGWCCEEGRGGFDVVCFAAVSRAAVCPDFDFGWVPEVGFVEVFRTDIERG